MRRKFDLYHVLLGNDQVPKRFNPDQITLILVQLTLECHDIKMTAQRGWIFRRGGYSAGNGNWIKVIFHSITRQCLT